MSIHVNIDIHGITSARADVFRLGTGPHAGKWHGMVCLDERATLHTDDYASKAEALMAAFDLVGMMQHALEQVRDAELTADLKESVEAAR